MFEDSQADPRQTVAIAQKFVSDPKIVVELGDFSSTASMAASPIYQRAGLVQFGFTNSHPNFTKGGDFIWSSSVSQADEQPRLAKYAADLGFKRLAVLYLNTDWGRTSQKLFGDAAKSYGAEVVASEGYQPDEKDFRSTLVRVRDAKPDAIVLISYYADGALIARQIRSVGSDQPDRRQRLGLFAEVHRVGRRRRQRRVHRNELLPRRAAAGGAEFRRQNSAPAINEEPDTFNTVAYDTIVLLAAVIEKYGDDRKAIRDGLAQIKDVPSVIFGKATFDPETRRVAGARAVYLIVKDGKFALWDGVKPQTN